MDPAWPSACSPPSRHGHIDVRDVEQVRVHGRLLLCVEIGVDRRATST